MPPCPRCSSLGCCTPLCLLPCTVTGMRSPRRAPTYFCARALYGCRSWQHQYSQAKIPHQNLQLGSHRLKTFPLRLCAPFWPPKTFHPHPAPSWRAMVVLQSKAPMAYRPGRKAGNYLGVLEWCHPSATHVAVLGDVPAMWETSALLGPHLASISDNTREFHSTHTHTHIYISFNS